MRVFVLVVVRVDASAPHPPSVWHLQRRACCHSTRSCRATSGAFLWTRDTLFNTLHRVDLEAQNGGNGGKGETQTPDPAFWYFSALLDVGGCEEEVEVIAMLLMDLCRSWPGCAAHVEVCRTSHHNISKEAKGRSRVSDEETSAVDVVKVLEREETLLVVLAEAIEADGATQDTYLQRWGVDTAWDYAQALQGRCWLSESGYVAVLPTSITTVVDYFLAREVLAVWSTESTHGSVVRAVSPQLTRDALDTVMDGALQGAILEKTLSEHFGSEVDTVLVPQRLYDGAFHQLVVAVPPAMALFLSRLPSTMLHDALLFHTHDRPLAPFNNHAANRTAPTALSEEECKEEVPVVIPAPCADVFNPPDALLSKTTSLQCTEDAHARYAVAASESQRIGDLFHEYDILLTNKGAVRVPLPPVSRYVFTLLLCQCDLPATLMAPFIRRHAAAIRESCDVDSEDQTPLAWLTEEEIVLGMKVTWAVQRWTSALRRPLRDAAQAGKLFRGVYSRWMDAACVRDDAYAALVQRHMTEAQQAAQQLSPKTDTVERIQLSTTTTTAMAVRRMPQLHRLEQRLFYPRAVSYRGSSTEWVVRAVRDVGEHYARVPASLMNGGRGEGLADVDAADAEEEEDVSESEESREDALKDGGDDDGDDFHAEQLLEQMGELETMLQREVQHSHSKASKRTLFPFPSSPQQRRDLTRNAADGKDAEEEQKSDMWMTTEDAVHVSQNELFLNHVQLFGAEL